MKLLNFLKSINTSFKIALSFGGDLRNKLKSKTTEVENSGDKIVIEESNAPKKESGHETTIDSNENESDNMSGEDFHEIFLNI